MISDIKSLAIMLMLSVLVLIQPVLAENACVESLTRGDYKQSLDICEAARQDTGGQDVSVLLALVEIHHELGHQDREHQLLNSIKSHQQFNDSIEFQYDWNRRVGQKYYFLKDYQQAGNHLNQGLLIAESENNLMWQIKSHNDVGLVAYRLKDNVKALQHFNQSLALKLNLGTSYQIGKTLNNIALVHMQLEEPEKAIDYYEQALEQYLSYIQGEDFDERVYQQVAHIYEDLNQAYTAQKNTSAAQDYAIKILTTFEQKHSPKAKGRALMNLGKHHTNLQQYSTALMFFEEAEHLYQVAGYPLDADYFHHRALIANHTGDVTLAKALLETGLPLAQADQDHRLLAKFYASLSDLNAQSEPQLALTQLKSHVASREQFLQDKYDQDLSTIEHEVEKQQIQHDLINEQLISAQKSVKLQRMTNGVLIITMVFLLLLGTFIVYMFNKKRERHALLKSIKHHEQQLFLMQHQPEHVVEHDQTESQSDTNLKQNLKRQLVSTMLDGLTVWEKTTGKDRIELAEQSKVWTISIDNGTLRTRSLDKYLDIEEIPQNPRWRNVVKTCHFILSQEQLSSDDRRHMEDKLSSLLDHVKTMSLGKTA